jgi:hypothetical protein
VIVFGRRKRPAVDPTMAGLRQQALRLGPGDMDLEPLGATGAFGAVIDLGEPGGVATLVALADGTTSLYMSTGGGLIGGGGHVSVATAARKCIVHLARKRDELARTDDEGLPGKGFVRFHLLHEAGRRMAEVREDLLLDGAYPLADAYASMHEVVTQIRIRSGSMA